MAHPHGDGPVIEPDLDLHRRIPRESSISRAMISSIDALNIAFTSACDI